MDDIGQTAIGREDLYTAALGERFARYYVPKFLAFEEGTKRFSFNVWALLFGAFWFCYRRMWISALVLWIGGMWLVGFLLGQELEPRTIARAGIPRMRSQLTGSSGSERVSSPAISIHGTAGGQETLSCSNRLPHSGHSARL
jgi:hypothetical protein